jgi:ferredoxin
MQTSFTLTQLADPDLAEADKILRACVHCGFCTATCPTYTLLGDELDSPRGRIYLIKDMLENDRPATADVVTHIDRCLSCLSCMTTCPSGVHYMHLVDHARAHIQDTYRRPLIDRTVRAVIARVLPDPKLFRWSLLAAYFAKPLAPLFDRIGLKPLAAMLRLAAARRCFARRANGAAASRCSPAAPATCSRRRSTRRRFASSPGTASRWCWPRARAAAARSSITWGARRRRLPPHAPTSTRGCTRSTAKESIRS